MRLADQPQFLAHGGGRGTDFLDRPPQFLRADAEMPGPVMNFMRLSHGDMASIAGAGVEKIIAHLFQKSSKREKASPVSRRGLLSALASCPAWRNKVMSRATG